MQKQYTEAKFGDLECHPTEFELFHPEDSKKALKALIQTRVKSDDGKQSQSQERSESQGMWSEALLAVFRRGTKTTGSIENVGLPLRAFAFFQNLRRLQVGDRSQLAAAVTAQLQILKISAYPRMFQGLCHCVHSTHLAPHPSIS